jgi:hypothetical protein
MKIESIEAKSLKPWLSWLEIDSRTGLTTREQKEEGERRFQKESKNQIPMIILRQKSTVQ